MPTVFTHALVPLIGSAALKRRLPKRLVIAGALVAMLPDADVAHRAFDISQDHIVGHRGVTHSLAFAGLVGLIGAALAPVLKSSRRAALLFLFLCCASHPLLDMLTDGGRGIALLWPFSSERMFAPVTPVRVSPIVGPRFFSPRGVEALASELFWIVLPLTLLVALVRFSRKAAD